MVCSPTRRVAFVHSLLGISLALRHPGEMSTRIGNLIGQRFQPRLLPALLKVAVIGAWEGRGLPDEGEDLEQAEILAMIAAEAPRPTAAVQPVAPRPTIAADADPQHPAAA